MVSEVVRRRLELRRSNAAVPHRNRAREHKTGRAPYEVEDIYCDFCGRRLKFGLCPFCDGADECA